MQVFWEDMVVLAVFFLLLRLAGYWVLKLRLRLDR